ncbi:MAG: hypothetical protein ACFCUE_12150 [Candidatus Bathyarchaeia archaeon]|jgi:hypothetical protein
MSAYDEQRKKEQQLTKDLALADVKDWISKIPKEKLNQPVIVVGSKTFTPQEIKREVENDSEYGKQFTQIMAKSRAEFARRKTK